MKKFKVQVSRDWKEYGFIIVDAEDKDDAREFAREALIDGSDDIKWQSDNMDPQGEDIEGVEEIEQEPRAQ